MRKSRSPSIWTSLISDMPVLLHFDNSLSEVSVFAIQHSHSWSYMLIITFLLIYSQHHALENKVFTA
jgi:hypothetical protein